MAIKDFKVKNGLETPALKITGLGSVTVTGYLTRDSSGVVGTTAAVPTVTIGSTSIALGATSTTLAGLTSVAATTFTGALTGNASTATTLQTARTINGTSFDGSANITVTAAAGTLTGSTLAAGVTASSLTSVGTLTNLTVTNTITGTIQKATNLVGGNGTTLLGSIPYQSGTDTTTLLSPNTTTTKKFLRQTGTGANGAAPAWDTIVDGDLPSALTGKTYNGVTPTALATGFSIAGGTTSRTLTINNTIGFSTAGTPITITFPGTSDASVSYVGHTHAGSDVNSGTIGVAYGGTGLASYTAGDMLYASGTTTLAKLGAGAANTVLLSGTTPSWGKVALTTHVSGTLPIANGGTNSTATPTDGGIAFGNGTAFAFTAAGTSGQILQSAGTGNPVWAWAPLVSINQQTGTSYTIVAADAGKMIEMNNAAANTLYIPTDATYDFPDGTQITVLQTGSGQTTIAAVTPGTTTVNGTPGLKLRASWSSVTLIKRTTNTWVVIGDLSA